MTKTELTTISLKVYTETKDLFNTIKEESESATADVFLNLLLENFKNPRKVLHKAEDMETIKQLQTQVAELEEVNKQLQDDFLSLQNEKNEVLEANKSLRDRDAVFSKPENILFKVTELEEGLINGIIDYYLNSEKVTLTKDQALYLLIKTNKITR